MTYNARFLFSSRNACILFSSKNFYHLNFYPSCIFMYTIFTASSCRIASIYILCRWFINTYMYLNMKVKRNCMKKNYTWRTGTRNLRYIISSIHRSNVLYESRFTLHFFFFFYIDAIEMRMSQLSGRAFLFSRIISNIIYKINV